MVQALKEMKTGGSPEHPELSLRSVADCREVGVQVMVELCQRVRGGWDMPAVSESSWWMGHASCVREFLVDEICQLCQRALGGWDMPAVSESSWWMGNVSCVREYSVDGICQLCQIVLGG